MRKEMLVVLLGLWVTFIPYLGIPASWRTISMVCSGILILFIGLLLRGEAISRGDSRRGKRNFLENNSEQGISISKDAESS